MLRNLPPIYFHYLTPPFYFPNRSGIKKFLLSIFNDYSKKVENVNYIFCTDKYLLSLNSQYLNHNYYTDIITFQLNDSKHSVVSDIYISLESARENAELHSVSSLHEIMRLLIHGALHLCGQKDKTQKEFKRMKELEDLYLNKWFHVKQKLY
jgi:probable rRNA maturation factor